MQLSGFIKQLVIVILLSQFAFANENSLESVSLSAVRSEKMESIAFYYNRIDSVRELMNYERVVVSPSLITEKQIKTLHSGQTSVFAYLSVGEFSGSNLPNELANAAAAKNPNWYTYAMDLTDAAWQQFLKNLAIKYINKGFDGLFLDTLDSYLLFSKEQSTQAKQEKALIRIINSFYALNPNVKLIFNRGFDVVERLERPPYALVAESLYHSYSHPEGRYSRVKESDSKWLRGKLEKVKELGIEVIVIDYIPSSDREAQKKAARRLIDEGYTPYISDGLLYELGVSTVEPIAKRVLGIYDGSRTSLIDSQCHRMMSMPIEYHGYVPDCKDVNKMNFSSVDMTKYASVFVWLDQSTYSRERELQNWLMKIINTRPILFINSLPTEQSLLAKLGVKRDGELSGGITLTKGKEWVSNRHPLLFSDFDIHPRWTINDEMITERVVITDNNDDSSSLFFTASWGGAILAPLPITRLVNNSEAWLVDPFRLIEETLTLAPIPAADVTTESGRRILTSYIKGNGFSSKGWFRGQPYSSQVLLENIFESYTFPQTVSVVEDKLGKPGESLKENSKLETVARDIFKLPHIEIASHYSAPSETPKKRHGNLKNNVGYCDEIHKLNGYINYALAPEAKKVKLTLWTANNNVSKDDLVAAEQSGFVKINDGSTYLVQGNNKFTQVSPTVAWYPADVQIYAPVVSENRYTNFMSENHDGYARVIETFDLAGNPRRLKTVSIYYHMYSGIYPAALNSLLGVYDWTLGQKVTPLYLSEYISRAKQLYETGLAKTLEGSWVITSSGVRSIRIPDALGYPVMNKSNIAGWDVGPDGKYLTLISPRTYLALAEKNNKHVRLANANAQITKWMKKGNVIKWAFKSHVPFKVELANAAHCKVSSSQLLEKSLINNTLILHSKQAGIFSGQFSCKTMD